MTHVWRGRKPHLRAIPREMEGHRGFRTVEIHPGEAFVPTTAELTSFHDLLEPLGAGLRMPTSVLPAGVPRVNPDLMGLVHRAHGGQATNDEQALVGDVLAFLDAHAHGQDTPAMREDLSAALSEFAMPLFVGA